MNLEQLLIRHEGFVPHAYQDSEGYWTIGIGHLIDKRKGGGITEEQARAILRDDLQYLEFHLDHYLPWWRHLSAVRRMVMQSMAFNLGINGLLGFKRFIAALKCGDYEMAALEMLQSKWAGQVGRRARELAHMMKSDVINLEAVK